MRIAESLLGLLSKNTRDAGLGASDECSVANALDSLREAFPGLDRVILGKDILDFGCGAGLQCAAMALGGAEHVLGVDTNPRVLERASKLAHSLGLERKVAFAPNLEHCHETSFDLIISQNGMEHFSDAADVLEQMKSALRPDGRIFVSFGPPWLAPYGSHMEFFTSVPWVNILFSERVVMNVRSRHVDDGAEHYEDVESGLNRMTVRRFERLIEQGGFDMTCRRYQTVKGLPFLSELPFARELFINHVSCVLAAREPSGRRSSS